MGDIKSRGESVQTDMGDRRETSGDKWETNVKSCGQSIQSVLHEGKQ